MVCLSLLVLYLLTAAPSLGWRDAPEFAATTQTLGIAHPAGFPTYSLLSKLLTFLPLGSLPFRVTLFSAFCAAAALYLLYELVRLISIRSGGSESSDIPAAWAAAGTALVFGLTPTFWSNAVETEVYTLNTLFLGAILYCALRWSEKERDAWLFAGALIYGLAAGNHATVAFYLPGLLAYVVLHSHRQTWRRLLWLCFFFWVGFSVYLYLPIRSAADPTFDFGNPETWQRLLMHITDRKDTAEHFAAVRESGFLSDLWIFLSQTNPKVFWVLGLPLLVLGVRRLWRSNRPLVVALTLISLVNVLFFLRYTNATAFLPTYFCAALLCGLGAAWLLGTLGAFTVSHRKAAGAFLAVLLAGTFAGGVWYQYQDRDRSRAFLAGETFRDDFESLDPDAVTLTAILWFHHRAFQDIYRLREDVTVIGLADFIQPKIFNPVTTRRFPKVTIPEPEDKPNEGPGFLFRFVKSNLDKGLSIYFEPTSLTEQFYPNLDQGLDFLFKFTREPVQDLPTPKVQAYLERLKAKIKREVDRDDFLAEPEIDTYYFYLAARQALYLRLHGRPQYALALLKLLDKLFGPEGKNDLTVRSRLVLATEIGTTFLFLGDFQAAERHLRQAMAMEGTVYAPVANLGLVLLKMDRIQEAIPVLERAAAMDPRYPEAFFHLGECYLSLGKPEKARGYYEQALKVKKDGPTADLARKRLGAMAENAGVNK
ncbi:MAG: DUF2723 domain-containing protein, partial [Pseudomonadota bacterium]